MPGNEPGKRLREWREAQSITQRVLSERLGVSRSYIGDIEAGRVDPSRNFLNVLQEKFGVRADYILHGLSSRPDPVLLMICGAAVRRVYAESARDLSPEDQFNQAVWVYGQILDQVADPEDGDAIEAALPQVRHLLKRRLLQADSGGIGTGTDQEVTE